MSFAWAEYLDLAHDLAGLSPPHAPSEEARLRSAISRAYYAVERSAFQIAQAKDGYVHTMASGRGSHEDLIYHFRSRGEGTRFKVGHNLRVLLTFRVQADYHDWMAPTTLRSNAIMCCQIALHVQELLAQIP